MVIRPCLQLELMIVMSNINMFDRRRLMRVTPPSRFGSCAGTRLLQKSQWLNRFNDALCLARSLTAKTRLIGIQAFHYKISAKQGFILCDEGGLKAALDLAGIRIPYPKSSVDVAGRSYTFRSDKEVTPAQTEAVIDLLKDECGEVEFKKVFK